MRVLNSPTLMRNTSGFLALASLAVAAPVLLAQTPAARPEGRFALTVDSIMRGPDLVGYAPDNLRWSADSQKLYFDWREPGEEETSTYVVGRAGGAPVRLTDAEKKNAPPATGRWDKARRRLLFADRGDIVILDAGGTRRWITKTTAGEGSPRWARNDTAITYVREGNLFLVPLDGGGAAGVQQLTDVAPRRVEPRLTDSQKFIRDEQERLLDAVREARERKKKAEEKDKLEKLPAFELGDRQT